MVDSEAESSVALVMSKTQIVDYLVREQYEAYPYPERDPADEHRRLLNPIIDALDFLNYYGFSGKKRFEDGFDVLIAGGGTGDSTIFLAEQLRGKPARIVHLDISAAAINIAKKRAEVRGLDNIDWIQGSILETNHFVKQSFDYINCSGVLHHLEDPAGITSPLINLNAVAWL